MLSNLPHTVRAGTCDTACVWKRAEVHLPVYGPGRDLASSEGNGLGKVKLEQEKGILRLLKEAPNPETRLVEALRARILVQPPEGTRATQEAAVSVHGNGALRVVGSGSNEKVKVKIKFNGKS